MPTSQNGWSASPDLAIRPLVIAGESFSPGVRDDDDVYDVLRYVAEQLHARVEPIERDDWHQADDWGFYYRTNANDPNSLSNHSSATAFDYNATRHPNGVPTSATFSLAQIREVHLILAEVEFAVRWGGDYTGTPDAMHFEINTDARTLAAVAQRIRQGDDDMPYTPDELRAIVRGEIDAALADIGDERVTNPDDKGPGSRSLAALLWMILRAVQANSPERTGKAVANEINKAARGERRAQ